MTAPALTVYVNNTNAVGADQLNTFMQTCNTAADMRNVTGVTGMQIWARGISTINDGLGGSFYWNATSTANDDNLNTIAPYASKTGRWARNGTTSITQIASGQFYQNLGATINRLNDRVFVGAATINDGNNPNTVQDYVSINIPQGATTSVAQFASLSTIGGIGGLFGSRTSDSGNLTGENGLALMAVAINDNAVNPGIAEAAYFEAQQRPHAGVTTTVEIDAVNQTGVVTTVNPYSSFLSATAYPYSISLGLAAGGARAGVSNSSAAIVIQNNGAFFDKGIVFLNQAISGGSAMSMPSGLTLNWWGPGGVATSFIQSTGTAQQYGIVFTDAGTFLGNSPAVGGSNAVGGLEVVNLANTVNYVTVSGSVSGSGPIITAAGSDTNIDLNLVGQGTGYLRLGGAVATSATAGSASALPGAPQGYLTVRINNTGAVAKIPYWNS